jgi:hypothetical protein
MGKRDAFGNEIDGDENPLDSMGWKVGQQAEPSGLPTTPVAASPPVAQAPPVAPTMPTMPASPSAQPRFDVPSLPTQLPNIPGGGRSFNAGAIIGRLVSLVIVLAVLGGIGVGVFAAFDTAKDVKNAFTIPKFTVPSSTVPGITPPAATPEEPTKAQTPSKPAKAPSGLQPASLLRAEEFGRALVKMRAQGGRVQTMRVDPTRISANLLNNANSLRIFSTTWEGDVSTVKTSSVLSGTATVSLSAINSRSPSRAVARAAALLGRTARQVNYLVLLNFAGDPQWMVYFKDGKYVRASLDGRRVQRVN